MLWRQGVEVVTNVAHDHLEVARHTLEAIATEKSGIVNPLTPSSWGPWPARRWRSFETGPPSVGHRSWHATGDDVLDAEPTGVQGGVPCVSGAVGRDPAPPSPRLP